MGLTTLLGAALLDVQDAVRQGVHGERAPNLVVVSLARDAVTREFGEDNVHVRARVRREVESDIRRTIIAHGWIVGGCGDLSVSVLVRRIDREIIATARTVPWFAELRIREEGGSRIAPMLTIRAMIGREHHPLPPGFIGLHDPLRLVSRRHLELSFDDLELRARLVGRNPTTLNGNPLGDDAEVLLSTGDEMRCGTCEVVVAAIART